MTATPGAGASAGSPADSFASAESAQPVAWPVFPDRDDLVFRGRAPRAGAALISVEAAGGDVLGVLTHHVRHSPTGFQWGYTGSGPAETARCLLLAALDDPRCEHCAGTRKVVVDGDGSLDAPLAERAFTDADDPDSELVLNCYQCTDGLASVPYQRFKFEVVASWGAEWHMTRSAIRAWLQARAEEATQ